MSANRNQALPPAHDPKSLIWLLRRSVQRHRAPMSEALRAAEFGDLPQQGMWALSALSAPASSARDLVIRMDISKQAVAQLVDTLVALGYVERREFPDDRRRTLLALTERGEQASAVIDRAVEETETAMAGRIGADRLEALYRILLDVEHPDGSRV